MYIINTIYNKYLIKKRFITFKVNNYNNFLYSEYLYLFIYIFYFVN